MHGHCRRMFTVTNNAKLRSFQRRIIMDAVVLNKFLYRLKIKTSASCRFCKEQVENKVHILWECEIIQVFTDKLITLIRELCPM